MVKKFILFSLICAFTKCRFIKQKCETINDPFAKSEIVRYRYSHEHDWFPPYRLLYEIKNDSCRMELSMSFEKEIQNVMPIGSEIKFALENGEILKFYTDKYANPRSLIFNRQFVYTEYTYSFPVKKDVLSKLTKTTVNIVRFPNPSTGSTSDIKLFSKPIMKGAKCVSGIE
jgi:hypothetical protein